METQYKKNLTLEDFSLFSVIGKGSFAKVLLVQRKATGKTYALKVIKRDQIGKKKQEEHIKTERNALVSIDHPFVIKLAYAFKNDRKLFFALEYCPGGELFNLLIRRKYFSEDQARFYAAQVLLAIEHVHSKDIIYRDLKPENVLIDEIGYIRIADFGLSKRGVTGAKDAKSIVGTPEYFAPEIVLKKGHGKPVDWWTFGCFLYELLTGIPPFYTTENSEVFENELFDKIVFGYPRYPSSFSPSVKDLLTRLLEKDPTQRLGFNGAKEVKNHPWFYGTKWDALIKKEIIPPFVPKLSGELDVSNFSPEFTESPVDPAQDRLLSTKSFDSYTGFTYTSSVEADKIEGTKIEENLTEKLGEYENIY